MQNDFMSCRIQQLSRQNFLLSDCQHFSGMEVHGTVLITKLVDRGTKEALGGQTSPLEMERQVYQTKNVVFGVQP